MTLIPYLEAFEFLWKWMKKKPAPPAKELRILIVEDNANDAELLRHDIEYCGHKTTVAENAEAALALVKRNNLDVVFVDMRLTYMNGWELIPLIWRHSPHSQVVVICGQLIDLANILPPHKPFTVMVKPVNADDLCHFFELLK